MSDILTRRFGQVSYSSNSVYRFPSGLPGFEQEKSFIFVHRPDTVPLIYMQSVNDPGLCFILLPILVVDREYRLEITPDDAEELQLPADRQPRIGEDVLCGALVCAGENVTPTVNLMAPIVVNIRDRIGMQIIRPESHYSCRFPLTREELPRCS